MADNDAHEKSMLEQVLGYFDVSVANNDKELADIYHVRYRVYCEEFGYEPKEIFANREETDEFDERSLHCAIRHRASARVAAISRVVTVHDRELLPLEAHCGDHIDQDFMARFDDRRESICEISRLAVDGDFRRRRGEKRTRFGDAEGLCLEADEKRTFPLLGLSAALSAFATAEVIGRTNLFAIMEPFLPKLMARAGIYLQCIGEEFDYRGARAPYYLDISGFEDGMRADAREFYRHIRRELRSQLVPSPQTVNSRSRRQWLRELLDYLQPAGHEHPLAL
jgi:N-acyl amino acid synthase of PEP-CTERM/exosortase system